MFLKYQSHRARCWVHDPGFQLYDKHISNIIFTEIQKIAQLSTQVYQIIQRNTEKWRDILGCLFCHHWNAIMCTADFNLSKSCSDNQITMEIEQQTANRTSTLFCHFWWFPNYIITWTSIISSTFFHCSFYILVLNLTL